MSTSARPMQEIRKLDVTDLERIARFRRARYGGSVSDALHRLGVKDTIFSQRFKPLRQGMQLVGRALPVKLHSQVDYSLTPGLREEMEKRWEAEGGHPQKRMMQAVAEAEPGVVLCFDCGGDMQAAQFGEMSCQLAYAHGCRGMLLAGNCRDTQYILKMPDLPLFSFGTTPNAFGAWIITEIDRPIYLPGHLTRYVRVMRGDFIFGDSDGVQLVPNNLVDEVLLRVESTFERGPNERRWPPVCRSMKCTGCTACYEAATRRQWGHPTLTARLAPLVEGEMPQVLRIIGKEEH